MGFLKNKYGKIEIDGKDAADFIIAENPEKFIQKYTKENSRDSMCTWTNWKLWWFHCTCIFPQYFKRGTTHRFTQNGFNLDLSYITQNIIVMQYPSSSLFEFSKNSRRQVIKMFLRYHNKSVKIYNLWSENDLLINAKYRKDFKKFKQLAFPNNYEEPIKLTSNLIIWIDSLIYLSRSEKNVVAFHDTNVYFTFILQI